MYINRLKNGFRNFVLHLVPNAIFKAIQHPLKLERERFDIEKLEFGQISYSQEGEDIFLNRIFNFKPNGIFIDIGAHHPKRFSNTYLFYKMGWRGVNIDAMPGSMESFKSVRPFDVNIEAGVGMERGKLVFYIFQEPALNTFDEQQAKTYQANGWVFRSEKLVEVYPLDQILDENLKTEHIDFMSIDVEGFEINILKSNNWEKYRPDYLLIEDLQFNLNGLKENQVYQFLLGVGYSFIGKTLNTIFYKAN